MRESQARDLANTQLLCLRPLTMLDFSHGGRSLDWNSVSQARRRLEKEQGTIFKDWGGRIPIALVYPNTYRIGMSNLGLHVIYRLLNDSPHVVCERVFYHRNDRRAISLESQRALRDFPVLAFSLSFEMDYFNVIALLRQGGIPLSSQERDERLPLLIGGGPCVTANPEPLAPVFDAFVIGEGEPVVPRLTETLRQHIDADREELLRRLAAIPGIYVPHLYDVKRDDERVVEIRPPSGVPCPVQRQWVSNLDAYPASSAILTEDTEFGDMYLLEVTRGCARRCRFCLAGVIYLPARERSLDTLLALGRRGLKWRPRLGLIGASLSDYSHIEELATGLRDMGAAISVASLRVDPLPEPLLRALAESHVQTLTVAPEAGSQRLRRRIGKGISTDQIMHAAELASRYNFPHLKLYFMLGLPTETDQDAEQIVDLLRAIRKTFTRRLTVNVTPFVPKPQTPFQRTAMAPLEVLERRLHYVKRHLGSMNIAVRSDSGRWAQVQAVLARGDRRVGEALMSIPNKNLSSWRKALERAGLEVQPLLASRSEDEILPWASVSSGMGTAAP